VIICSPHSESNPHDLRPAITMPSMGIRTAKSSKNLPHSTTMSSRFSDDLVSRIHQYAADNTGSVVFTLPDACTGLTFEVLTYQRDQEAQPRFGTWNDSDDEKASVRIIGTIHGAKVGPYGEEDGIDPSWWNVCVTWTPSAPPLPLTHQISQRNYRNSRCLCYYECPTTLQRMFRNSGKISAQIFSSCKKASNLDSAMDVCVVIRCV
jgi:hypothetical protein